MERFIETLIYSPRAKLGNYVHSLNVEWDRSSLVDPAAYPVSIWPPAFHNLVGYHGTHCVLLLHILPSVRFLKIIPLRDIPDVSQSYISHCLEAPQGGPAVPTLQLQSLRIFMCPYADNHGAIPRGNSRGGITSGAVLALMKLPCIETIDTHLTDWSPVPPAGSSNNVRFSTVNSLRLSGHTMSTPALSILLNAPVALTRFSYVSIDLSEFYMSEFTTAMLPLKASLEYLYLDLMRSNIMFTTEKVERICDFIRLWPSLHTLSCSARELMGYCKRDQDLVLAELLPRGLRGLRVVMDHCWGYDVVVRLVVELIRTKEVAMPLFESVALMVWWERDDAAHVRLQAACVKSGVRLVEYGDFCW